MGHSYNQSMGSLPLLGGPPPPTQPQHERSYSHGSTITQNNGSGNQQYRGPGVPSHQSQPSSSSRFDGSFGPVTSQGPPQLGALSFQNSSSQPSQPSSFGPLSSQQGSSAASGSPQTSALVPAQTQLQTSPLTPHVAPARPVFGVNLSTLYERDGLAVPMVVYQCIQAVDLFGLNVEGIYRLSGSMPHVNKLKNLFDTGSCSPSSVPARAPHTDLH